MQADALWAECRKLSSSECSDVISPVIAAATNGVSVSPDNVQLGMGGSNGERGGVRGFQEAFCSHSGLCHPFLAWNQPVTGLVAADELRSSYHSEAIYICVYIYRVSNMVDGLG